MPNTLYLRLEAPLQSWGERGRWSIRDSAPFPTKSGIIGLVGCAMGVGDDATLRMLTEQTQLAIRIDRPGTRLTDYHTIGGGYATPMLLTAQGKPKKTPAGTPHTELSFRDYLCDAAFVAALWSANDTLIERIAQAVQNPVWTIFLGRKSCPPALPIFMKTATISDLKTAIDTAPPTERMQPNSKGQLRIIVESTTATPTMIRDQITSRQHRRFAARFIKEAFIDLPLQQENN